MQICEVTGRKYLNRRELTAELARLDKLIADMEAIEKSFLRSWDGTSAVHPQVAQAWNATNDAIDRLRRERGDVEANPRPIPAGEAGTYALVKDNID